MDISHFKYLIFKDNFYLKKFKKNKKLYFFSFEMEYLNYYLLKIKNFKEPTKYKKKGFFLDKVY